MRRSVVAALIGLCLAACSSPNAGGVGTDKTTPGTAFDVAAVKANFTDECKNPIVVDDLFCEQVKTDQMWGSGTTLTVPSTLNSAATDRAGVICSQAAAAHFDGDGNDLRYQSVEVLDKDGTNAAVCQVP